MPADRDLLEAVARSAFPDAEIEHLGTGGFASTFKVMDGDSVLAVKVLDPDKSGDIRTERERRALIKVDDPNVVRYERTGGHTYGDRTYRYLVMEFVDGRSLLEVLEAAEPMPVERIIAIGRNVADGLAAIWRAQLAHRDLTPKNIMIRQDGRAVIVDLGIARHLELETVTVLPTPGTPGWMAPEQVGIEPEHGDWRSDQYVLGLVLYLLSTGVLPFNATNVEELWRAPAVEDLRSPRAVNPNVPVVLSEVIGQMTAREPFQRYLQPAQLVAALEAAAAQLVDGSPMPTAGPIFAFVQGQRKNFADQGFFNALKAEVVLLDARNMNEDKARELGGCAEHVGCRRIVDPVSYFDRSPQDARPAGYRALPYGDAGVARTGFADDADRQAYCSAIVEYQLAVGVDVVLAPYFFSRPTEIVWLRETLTLAQLTRELLAERNVDLPVWTAAAVSADFFRSTTRLNSLLNLLTGAAPETLYLLVHTSQAANTPLRDLEILKGMRTLIDTLRQAGTATVVGRRFTEGLLLCALGAAGWSTGVSAVYQDFTPHPEAPDDSQGGQGLDWMYVPRLLNSISLPRRAVLRDAHPQVFDAQTPSGRAVFTGDARRTSLDTNARMDLVRHNAIAMRQQLADLASVPSGQRLSTMRDWVKNARTGYTTMGGPWHAAENPGFLDEWLQAL